MGKSQHYCTDSLLITTEKTRMKAWKMYKMYKCVRVCGTQMATQRQRSLASAAHRFMFPAKYHYTKLIDEAAVNAFMCHQIAPCLEQTHWVKYHSTWRQMHLASVLQ